MKVVVTHALLQQYLTSLHAYMDDVMTDAALIELISAAEHAPELLLMIMLEKMKQNDGRAPDFVKFIMRCASQMAMEKLVMRAEKRDGKKESYTFEKDCDCPKCGGATSKKFTFDFGD